MAAPIYNSPQTVPKTLNDLLDLLSEATLDLQASCQASVPIRKGNRVVGHGISKSKKSMAADRVTSIVREIKAV